MYRLSNGVYYTGKTELAKSYIVCTGNVKSYISTDGWKLIKKMPDGSRVYFSNYLGQLHMYKKPLDNSYFQFVSENLDRYNSKTKHPSIIDGLSNEASRIFPKINKNVEIEFQNFIDYLNVKYDLENKINSEKDLHTYSDDIGPFFVLRVGIHKFLIPELPDLYLAPKIWRELTWIINNSFSGPYPKNKKDQYFSWGDLKINDTFKTYYCEGTALYLIAKYIIIYEAWMTRETCDALSRYIDLVMREDVNPWKQLY